MSYQGKKCQYKTYAESTSPESKQWLKQIGIDKLVCINCTGYLGFVKNCNNFQEEYEGGLIEMVKQHGRY